MLPVIFSPGSRKSGNSSNVRIGRERLHLTLQSFSHTAELLQSYEKVSDWGSAGDAAGWAAWGLIFWVASFLNLQGSINKGWQISCQLRHICFMQAATGRTSSLLDSFAWPFQLLSRGTEEFFIIEHQVTFAASSKELVPLGIGLTANITKTLKIVPWY